MFQKEFQPVETERFSAAALCSMRLSDGRYVLQLNPSTSFLTPIGGAYKYKEKSSWNKFVFESEGDGDLRGKVTDSAGMLSALQTGANRETTPLREIEEELLEPLRNIDPDLSQDDIVSFHFRTSHTNKAPTTRLEEKGEETSYYWEIFDVKVSPRLENAIKEAAQTGEGGIVLATSNQIEELYPISLPNSYDPDKKVPFAPTCKLILVPRTSTYDRESSQEIRERIYNEAKRLAFSFEGKGPGPIHRLTLEDLDLLRRYSDADLVDELEHTIVTHRLSSLLIDKLAGAAAEAGTVSINSTTIQGDINLFWIAAVTGMLLTDWIGKYIQKDSEESVGPALDDVVNYISDHTSYDRHPKNRSSDTSLLVHRLAAGEQYWPVAIEVTPPVAFMDMTLLYSHQWLTALATSGFVAATQLGVREVLKTEGSAKRKFWRKQFAHLISSIAKYFPPVAASVASGISGSGVFSSDISSLLRAISVGSIELNHVADQLDAVEEIQGGAQARKDLRSWLAGLRFSLPSDKLRREHYIRILATEDKGITYGGNNGDKDYIRFEKLDELMGINTTHPKDSSTHFKGDTTPFDIPFAYFQDYTVAVGDRGRVLIDHSDMILPAKQIHKLRAPAGSGKSAILRAMADVTDHPRGSSYLRLKDTDVNLHGEPDKNYVTLVSCQGEHPSDLPTFSGDPSEVKNYLGETGLFSHREVELFISGDAGTRGFRTRIKLASAFQEASPIIFLDDLFYRGLSSEDIHQIVDFLKRQTEDSERIILIGIEEEFPDHREELETAGIMGKSFTISNRRIKEIPDGTIENQDFSI